MIEFFLHIAEDGQLLNEKAVQKAYGELTPGRWQVQMKRANRRSLPQNAYYWSVVVPMVLDGLKDAGYNEVTTTDQAHAIMKLLFLKKTISGLPYIPSTSELTRDEFSEYLENIFKGGMNELLTTATQHRLNRYEKILFLLSTGKTVKECAVELKMNPRTTEACVGQLKEKFNAVNTTHLIAICLRKGVIK